MMDRRTAKKARTWWSLVLFLPGLLGVLTAECAVRISPEVVPFLGVSGVLFPASWLLLVLGTLGALRSRKVEMDSAGFAPDWHFAPARTIHLGLDHAGYDHVTFKSVAGETVEGSILERPAIQSVRVDRYPRRAGFDFGMDEAYQCRCHLHPRNIHGSHARPRGSLQSMDVARHAEAGHRHALFDRRIRPRTWHG